MDQLVFVKNNEVLTDSITIAEMFEKRHDIVLRDIRNTMKSLSGLSKSKEVEELGIDMGILKFVETYYTNEQNKQPYPKFLLNFDSFMLVTMSYTTQNAMLVKVKYINEFNQMKEKLENSSKPKSQLEIMQMAINQLVEQEQRMTALANDIQETKKEVANISTIVAINPKNWRDDINGILNKIAIKKGNKFQEIRRESYELLEERACCNLDIRLKNRQKNMALEGVSKTKINSANKLDVIESDKRLTEIYLAIVKEMAIKYQISLEGVLV
mgnify:CR=1 FL=1